MVDVKHQGKGYGRAIMEQVIDVLKQEPGRDAIYISFEPSNDVARVLYSSLGFVDTGTMLEGETVFRLPLKQGVEG
jgi:diamine N-acetyltransferase